MRKSSKGNPYHVPAGSSRGGQFTTKNSGIAVIRNEGYYEAKTQLRKGEITEETFREIVKSNNKPSETPSYDTFSEKLKNNLDISTPNAKRALFKEVVESTGTKCNAPIRMTKGKCRTGACKAKIYDNGDGVRKEFVAVTLSSEYDDAAQLETLYHEAYHFCANKGLTSEYDIAWGSVESNKRDCGIEETMATCSAQALCKDVGISPGAPSYSYDLASNLPRLKHNTKRYADCNTIEDVGRIAWNDRIESKNAFWAELGDEMYSKPLPNGYYQPYIEHIKQNRERIVDGLVVKYKEPYNAAFRKEIIGYLTEACTHVSNGRQLSTLKRNHKLVFCDSLMYGFREMGIL